MEKVRERKVANKTLLIRCAVCNVRISDQVDQGSNAVILLNKTNFIISLGYIIQIIQK